MKLGGDYEIYDLNLSKSNFKATELLLEAMIRVCPEPYLELLSIAESVQKQYETAKNANASSGYIPEALSIMDKVKKWIAKYHLYSYWGENQYYYNQPIFLTVCSTVDAWAKNPNHKGKINQLRSFRLVQLNLNHPNHETHHNKLLLNILRR